MGQTLAGGALLVGSAPVLTPTHAAAATPRSAHLVKWSGLRLASGGHEGTRAIPRGLHLARAARTTTLYDPHTGRSLVMDQAQWTSEVMATQLAARELVPSWNASTPLGSAVRVWLRARSSSGVWSRWFVLGLWASSSAATTSPTRTTVNSQSDAVARIATDTLVAQSGITLSHFQLRLEFLRARGSGITAWVHQAAVVASTGRQSSTPVSPRGVGVGREVPVPAYSQMNHVGHYEQWNGGGEAWCAPTCTAMVLDRWGAGASAAELAWVRPQPHTDPQVEQAVRGVWDAGYRGTGNWAFNVAYASARGLRGFVTRLNSLTEAERFIAAGIPLIVSTSFSSTQLTGAGFGTNGHLMVVSGFDSAGNVMVNDPASGMKASNALVRRTYDRAQFESAWGRTAGTTYVIHPRERALPGRPSGLPRW